MAEMLIQEDPTIKRKRMLAQSMIGQGMQSGPVQHWMQGAGRLANALTGAYLTKQADEQSTERRQNAMDALTQALQGGGDYSDIAGQIAGTPGMENLAMSLMVADAKNTPPDAPSSVREYEYYNQLPEDQQEQYLLVKRANPYINLGGSMAQPMQTRPGELRADLPKTLPPQDRPEVKGEQKRATEQAALDVKKPEMQSKAKAALGDLERQTDIVTTNIDKALNLISPWSTGYGAFLSGMPETDAREMQNTLDTIRANVGFDKLQRLRDSSPTGGALGQVSEMENRLLQATSGALDAKSPDQLKENLQVIRDLYQEVLKEKQQAFRSDFGGEVEEEQSQEADIDSLVNKYAD